MRDYIGWIINSPDFYRPPESVEDYKITRVCTLGFKAFNKKSRELVFTKMLGDWRNMRAKGAAVNAGFDVETLFSAKKLGFNIAEVNVNWHYVGTERVQLINDSIEAVKDMLRIRWNDLNGKYS